jgi:hypothetical protein
MGAPDLHGCGKLETTKLKRLRDSKTLYLLLRKSNGITRGRLWPEGTTATIPHDLFKVLNNILYVFLTRDIRYKPCPSATQM